MSLLFYTAADRGYWHYAPLYAFFTLRSNRDALLEIALEDAEEFRARYAPLMDKLQALYGDRLLVRNIDFADRIPGVVRFVEEPRRKSEAENVYIGDVDILIFDPDVEAQHLGFMSEFDLPFSNKIRPRAEGDVGPRLTGLHFAPMDLQYPLPDLSDLDLSSDNRAKGYDETVLWEIMNRKGVMIPPKEVFNRRPEHGLHLSGHRHPFGRRKDGNPLVFDFQEMKEKRQSVGWSGIHKPHYRDAYREAVASAEFRELYFDLPIRARTILTALDAIVGEEFGQFCLDVSVFTPEG